MNLKLVSLKRLLNFQPRASRTLLALALAREGERIVTRPSGVTRLDPSEQNALREPNAARTPPPMTSPPARCQRNALRAVSEAIEPSGQNGEIELTTFLELDVLFEMARLTPITGQPTVFRTVNLSVRTTASSKASQTRLCLGRTREAQER